MNDSYPKHQHLFFDTRRLLGKHTCCRRILPEVTSLVSAEESLWLNCWCCTSRELLVEADYALHASCILSGADSLFPIRCVLPACCCSSEFAVLWRGSSDVQLERLSRVLNLQLEMPPMIESADSFRQPIWPGRGYTLGGMRVESARRVTKLILITAPPRQPN
jgi:hypothetical protein